MHIVELLNYYTNHCSYICAVITKSGKFNFLEPSGHVQACNGTALPLLHIHKIYKILHIKTLKTLRHVSVLRPSSGSYNFLAEVTLEIVTY